MLATLIRLAVGATHFTLLGCSVDDREAAFILPALCANPTRLVIPFAY